MYHKYRKWGGLPFGTKPVYNYFAGYWEPVEPFLGACGDCGREKELHVDTWTHAQKMRMLDDLAEEAKKGADRVQELIYFITKEMK